MKAFIVDAKNRALPPLVPGELIIAGAGVGRGYVGRDDLTKEKFIALEGLPAYRSGDMAVWSADGRIRFRGRTDNQVKLRGLRVELGEIESAINAVPGVLTSVVIMTGEANNQFLAGYYTATRAIAPSDLRAEIGKSLTAYMVPGVLTQLEKMPLTANGKIDRKKLPKVEYRPEAGEYAAPANEAEADFCGWFAELLNLEKVSATGNFFELGGTSLSAAVIAMNAADKGYGIVYADVFKAQTPRALAALATGAEPEKPSDAGQDALRKFDYGTLKLDGNVDEALPGMARKPLGNLLLTGATGFLGIHVLHEYLLDGEGDVYCLLRGDAPETRLKSLYFYYFNEALDEDLASGRVRVVPGDITDRESLQAAKDLPFDALINCAALVKHFVKDDSLERINVRGVENLIELCEQTGRRLIQTSTVSVAGEGLDGQPPRHWLLAEDRLYNGQLLDNAYALTDFSEIDMTARAILLLSGTDRRFTIFHPMNNHTVTYADIVYSMREYGFDIDTVEDGEFSRRMADAGDASGALIAYRSREGEERRYELGATCEFTTAALYRLGFKWPVSGEKYIVRMLKALDELTMFDD